MASFNQDLPEPGVVKLADLAKNQVKLTNGVKLFQIVERLDHSVFQVRVEVEAHKMLSIVWIDGAVSIVNQSQGVFSTGSPEFGQVKSYMSNETTLITIYFPNLVHSSSFLMLITDEGSAIAEELDRAMCDPMSVNNIVRSYIRFPDTSIFVSGSLVTVTCFNTDADETFWNVASCDDALLRLVTIDNSNQKISE